MVGKITRARFNSPSNVVVRNVHVLVLDEKLTSVRIPSWCNAFDGNVVILVGNLTHVRFNSPCNVLIRNSLVLGVKNRTLQRKY